MEAIDLDQLDKSDNVYKFASSAKLAMKKIANNEAITPDILKEFDEIFNSTSKQDKQQNNEEQQKANEMTEGADIFNDKVEPAYNVEINETKEEEDLSDEENNEEQKQ